MIIVRKAESSDARALLELIREHATFEKSAATISLKRLRELLADRDAPVTFFAAEYDGVVQGYASLTFDYATWRGEKFGHLDCLFVREATRGNGVGKQLFYEVIQSAWNAGADRLEWQTPDWNSDAIRFYNREGGIAHSKQRFGLDLGKSDNSQQTVTRDGPPKT